jgi:hypothetical protein
MSSPTTFAGDRRHRQFQRSISGTAANDTPSAAAAATTSLSGLAAATT